MESELSKHGFSEQDLHKLSTDIPELYSIVTHNDLSEEQLKNLKKTFYNIRNVEPCNEPVYEVDENGIVDLAIYKTIVPHPEYLQTNSNVNPLTTFQPLSQGSSGAHMMTYTDPSHRFYKVTGYVDLPTVKIRYNDPTYPYNSRPYIMYGAYGNGGGFDAGLTYYQETSSWRLFSYDLEDRWQEKNISLTGPKAYLWMELNGSNTIIKVIDPSTWLEAGSLRIEAPPSFTTNPYNVNITREVALAQFVRKNNGDYLKNAHWNQVHYYKINGFNTLATPPYLLSYVQGRYPYDSSMPKYLTGDSLADKSKITIRPQSNYSAEWVDIVLN